MSWSLFIATKQFYRKHWLWMQQCALCGCIHNSSSYFPSTNVMKATYFGVVCGRGRRCSRVTLFLSFLFTCTGTRVDVFLKSELQTAIILCRIRSPDWGYLKRAVTMQLTGVRDEMSSSRKPRGPCRVTERAQRIPTIVCIILFLWGSIFFPGRNK